MPSSYSITERQRERVLVTVSGELGKPTAEALEEEARARFSSARDKSLEVVIDLTELTDYEIAVRAPLVKLQRLFRLRARRTAYVADRPRARGLALWVVHEADDQDAKVTMGQAQANEWLNAAAGRVSDARRRTLELVQAVERSLQGASQRIERMK